MSFHFFSPDDISRQLAERLRRLRVAQNLSREELAARSGLSPGTVKRFETGQTVSLDNFVRLVQGLGRLNDLAEVLAERPAVTIEQLDRLEQAQRRQRPYRRSPGA